MLIKKTSMSMTNQNMFRKFHNCLKSRPLNSYSYEIYNQSKPKNTRHKIGSWNGPLLRQIKGKILMNHKFYENRSIQLKLGIITSEDKSSIFLPLINKRWIWSNEWIIFVIVKLIIAGWRRVFCLLNSIIKQIYEASVIYFKLLTQ